MLYICCYRKVCNFVLKNIIFLNLSNCCLRLNENGGMCIVKSNKGVGRIFLFIIY